MTFREKLAMEHPEAVSEESCGGCEGCPDAYGYEDRSPCRIGIYDDPNNEVCTECWNREMPEKTDSIKEALIKAGNSAAEAAKAFMTISEPHILDSGDRTEFETGAVRDMREGKGRCDLLPLDVVAECLADVTNCLDGVIFNIYSFQKHGDERSLHASIDLFKNGRGWDEHTMLLEVAKHFEEGAKKYGDNNWRKGIPVRCYIDSAIRHYLKYLRGDKDEPHDRAFCWNILCCIWTCKHMPDL